MNKEQLIIRYFENSFSPKELEDFNNLLKSDPELAEQVAFETDIKSAYTAVVHEELKKRLQQIESKKKRNNYKNWLSVAAGIIIIISATYYFSNLTPLSQSIYDEYYQTYANVVHPLKRENSQIGVPQTKAFMAYENEDFALALEYFKTIYATSSEEYALFYAAICFMELNNDSEAIKLFSENQWSDAYNEKALWFLSLAYIRQTKFTDARRVLTHLVTDGSYRTQESKEILQKLP